MMPPAMLARLDFVDDSSTTRNMDLWFILALLLRFTRVKKNGWVGGSNLTSEASSSVSEASAAAASRASLLNRAKQVGQPELSSPSSHASKARPIEVSALLCSRFADVPASKVVAGSCGERERSSGRRSDHPRQFAVWRAIGISISSWLSY
jgi:hypothetical protein